jgi:hypothetical protein
MRAIASILLPFSFFAILVLSSCEKKDDTAPVITILGDNPLIVAIGIQNFTDPGASATDDTDGDLSTSIETESNVNTNLKGNYSIVYSVSDAEGNTGTATRYVFVVNESEFLAGTWNIIDNKIGPGGTPIQANYQDAISTDDTLNNRFWVTMFGNNANARVYLDRVTATQCQIPQQEISCGTPPALHRFFGSATVVDTNQIIINYTEIVGGTTYSGSSTLTRR